MNCVARTKQFKETVGISKLNLHLFVIAGAVVSLAWLAIGFNLAAVNTPAITVHEKTNRDSHCAAYA